MSKSNISDYGSVWRDHYYKLFEPSNLFPHFPKHLNHIYETVVFLNPKIYIIYSLGVRAKFDFLLQFL